MKSKSEKDLYGNESHLCHTIYFSHLRITKYVIDAYYYGKKKSYGNDARNSNSYFLFMVAKRSISVFLLQFIFKSNIIYLARDQMNLHQLLFKNL